MTAQLSQMKLVPLVLLTLCASAVIATGILTQVRQLVIYIYLLTLLG